MPEIRQFTQGDFSQAFEGSAMDLLKVPVAPRTQTPATPATPTTPTTVIVATPSPSTDQDASDLLTNQIGPKDVVQKSEEEIEAEAQKAELEAKAATDAKSKGRPPVVRLDESAQKLFNKLIADKHIFGFQDGKIETEKDIQDLLDANINHKVEAIRNEAIQGAIQSLNPAMQAVLNYAQYVEDPSEILPFLTANSNVKQIGTLDETKPLDQERIVRERMKLNGDSEDLIAAEIQDLKDRGKLEERAKTYKPHLTQYYERQAQQLLQQRQQEEQTYIATVQKNEQSIRGILDAPDFEGVKLKAAHKGVVYELLAVPREQYGGGVGIYAVIDKLFMDGKFDKLAKVALLLGDEKGFEDVFSTKAKMAASDRTIRALNTADRAGGPLVTDNNEPDPPKNVLPRPTRNSFGFGTPSR